MKVNMYHVDQRTDLKSVEALNVELATCFPDDPDDAAKIEKTIAEKGNAYYGGGAQPLFYFVLAK